MLIVEDSYLSISPAPNPCPLLPELNIFAGSWAEIESWLKFSMRVRDKIQCNSFVASKLLARRIPMRYQLTYQIFYLQEHWFAMTPRAEIYTHLAPDWAIEGIVGGEEVDVSARFQENIDWTDF